MEPKEELMTEKERKKAAKDLIQKRSFILKKQKYTVLHRNQISDGLMFNLLSQGFITRIGNLGTVVQLVGLTWKEFLTKRGGKLFPGPQSTCYMILKDIKKF